MHAVNWRFKDGEDYCCRDNAPLHIEKHAFWYKNFNDCINSQRFVILSRRCTGGLT